MWPISPLYRTPVVLHSEVGMERSVTANVRNDQLP